jgi:hypothetical protein
MPEWTINGIPLPDHWRSLLDPEIASLFDVDIQEMKRLAEFTKDPTSGRFVFKIFEKFTLQKIGDASVKVLSI